MPTTKGIQAAIGMRFNDVTIPQGSIITSAYVEFEVDEVDTGATSLEFRAEDVDDAPAFTTAPFNLTTRAFTSAVVDWPNVPAWTTVSSKQQTPDLAPIIQEVVDRAGWVEGNSVIVVVTGSGERTAESYEGEAANAPLLHIEYSDTAGNSVPVVTNPGAQSSTVGDSVSLQIAATDADSDPLTFSATGLPSGLSISTSGLISGSPTVAGSYSVTVTADDGTDTGNAAFIWTVNDPMPPTGTVDVRISSGGDDVEETDGTGEMYSTSSDLEFMDDPTFNGLQSAVGLRFNGVNVPQGAVITSAYVEFEVDEADSGATSLEFRAEDVDNAPAFSTTAFDLTSRTTTSAVALWPNVPAWTTVSSKQQTPDLVVIVQEVVDRGGWTAGNSMVIVVTGSGERTAESYNGEAANAPLLHIEYSDTPANNAPVVTSPGNQTSHTGDSVSLQILATDGDGDPVTFSAAGLPPGLSIDTAGLITGSPTTAGSYSVTVTADDGTDTGDAQFAWT